MDTLFDRLEASIWDKKENIQWQPHHIKRAIISEAHRLFLEGVSFSEIARRFGLTRQTVSAWANKNGWVIQKERIKKEDSQKISDSVKEMKDRHIKIAKAIQGTMVNLLRQGDIKITATEGLKAMEHEARLTTPENYNNQNNFIDSQVFVKLLQEAKEEINNI